MHWDLRNLAEPYMIEILNFVLDFRGLNYLKNVEKRIVKRGENEEGVEEYGFEICCLE